MARASPPTGPTGWSTVIRWLCLHGNAILPKSDRVPESAGRGISLEYPDAQSSSVRPRVSPEPVQRLPSDTFAPELRENKQLPGVDILGRAAVEGVTNRPRSASEKLVMSATSTGALVGAMPAAASFPRQMSIMAGEISSPRM